MATCPRVFLGPEGNGGGGGDGGGYGPGLTVL